LWSYLGNSDQTKAKHREAEKDPACSFSHDEVFFNPVIYRENKVMGEKFLTKSNTGMANFFLRIDSPQ
jgi:hypothetical protein